MEVSKVLHVFGSVHGRAQAQRTSFEDEKPDSDSDHPDLDLEIDLSGCIGIEGFAYRIHHAKEDMRKAMAHYETTVDVMTRICKLIKRSLCSKRVRVLARCVFNSRGKEIQPGFQQVQRLRAKRQVCHRGCVRT